MEALKKEARLYVPKAHGPNSDDGESGTDEDSLEHRILDLKGQLDESRGKEVCCVCVAKLPALVRGEH